MHGLRFSVLKPKVNLFICVMLRFQHASFLKGLVVLSALLVFSGSCKKDTTEPEGITVLPEALVYQSTAGTVETFKIKGFSTTRFTRLKISTKKKNGFSVTRLDSSFAGREHFSLDWEFRIENALEDYELMVYFTLTDESGKEHATDRLIKVFISDPYLPEFSGIRMFSSRSGQADALNLRDLSTRNSALTPVGFLDVWDDSTAAGADTILGRRWISPAGGRFMRFNGFNFAEATENSLSGAIAAGTFSDKVEQIQQGDVILYKRVVDSLQIEAVIRVMGVYDQPGSGNDYYDLSVKKR